MRYFDHHQIREAFHHARQGGQALHVWRPPRKAGKSWWPGAPRAFQRCRLWAHLFDRDKDRLVATARRLGVRKICIHHQGTPRQHVDLCGQPLERACKEAQCQTSLFSGSA